MVSFLSFVGNGKRLQLPTNCLNPNSGGVEQFRFEIDAKPRSFGGSQMPFLNLNGSGHEVVILNEIVAPNAFEYK